MAFWLDFKLSSDCFGILVNIRNCGCGRDACDYITDGADHASRVAAPLDLCPCIHHSLPLGGIVVLLGCDLKGQ